MSSHPKPDEFELIGKYFAPLARHPGAFGLLDDAASISPPDGQDLILTADALIEGIHFLSSDAAASVARKLLRVNLSDLAAMGATPIGYLITTAWPSSVDETWIAEFCTGLAADQAVFGISLLGGDTVSTTGPIALSLTAIGGVPSGQALKRSGAQLGDLLFVTGTIGDGALGLRAAKGDLELSSEDDAAYLAERYRLPQPRTELGASLVGTATSAIDVSDGLAADAGHLALESDVAIEVAAGRVPLSPAANRAIEHHPELKSAVYAGGDDYELLFTASPKDRARIASIAKAHEVPITEIGVVRDGTGVRLLGDDGAAVELPDTGWKHF